MTPPTIYIAGPITGHPDYHIPFARAAYALHRACYWVINPVWCQPIPLPCRAVDAPDEPPTWHDWMRRALQNLASCDGVALLDGWAASRGASAEHRIATEVLDLPVRSVDEWVRLGGAHLIWGPDDD